MASGRQLSLWAALGAHAPSTAAAITYSRQANTAGTAAASSHAAATAAGTTASSGAGTRSSGTARSSSSIAYEAPRASRPASFGALVIAATSAGYATTCGALIHGLCQLTLALLLSLVALSPRLLGSRPIHSPCQELQLRGETSST